jgi:hypothetical protein
MASGVSWETFATKSVSANNGVSMDPVSYSRLAGAIFAIVAILQLVRALAGWPLTIAGTAIPVWASWVAFVIAAVLAWIGIAAQTL